MVGRQLDHEKLDVYQLALKFVAWATDLIVELSGSPEAQERLLTYPWKGNVRELRNAIERIVLLEEADALQVDHLSFLRPSAHRATSEGSERAPSGNDGNFVLPPEGVILDDLNKDLIRQALSLTGGNQVRAAKLLGLTRGTLRYRLDKYGIES